MNKVSPRYSRSIVAGEANEIQGQQEMVDENSWEDTNQDRLALTPICGMDDLADHWELREDSTVAT